MKKEKEKKTPMRLTVQFHIPVSPELKELVDQTAFDRGMATNEMVAEILANALKRPDLAKIPRKPFGRPRTRVKQPA